MNIDRTSLTRLTDEQLLSEVVSLAARQREATARLIAALAELDERQLFLGAGYSSLFTYCTQRLHLSEHSAYGRIEAARAARRFPCVLDLLSDGSVTLTTVCLLAPHLTPENHKRLLEAARHKSKREVEQQVAAIRPLPAVPSTVRKLTQRIAGADPLATPALALDAAATMHAVERHAPSAAGAPNRHAVIAPLAPETYKVQFTVGRETHDKLRRAQDLMRHSVPTGDPAVIFDKALTLLLEDLEKKKVAATKRPRPGTTSGARSRHVPAAVKREVWTRDGGRCAFVGADGRCTELGFLEYHHVVAFADGGPTTAANLQLRCRAHNAYEAAAMFADPESLLARESAPKYGPGPDQVRVL